MDTMIAVLVFIAIVVFGALIVAGNERQKHELANLRKAYEQWAESDLRMKRSAYQKGQAIESPTNWLARALSLATQSSVQNLSVHKVYPDCLVCEDGSGKMWVLSLLGPRELARRKRPLKTARLGDANPLDTLKRKEKRDGVLLSLLNAGETFDIELPIAWRMLTGQDIRCEYIWAYEKQY